MIRGALLVVVVFFPVSEVALAVLKRSRGTLAQREDRGSMRLLWFSIVLGVTLAMMTQGIPSARLAVPPAVVRSTALVLLVGGLVIRWVAILTLGRFFTVDVAIHADHPVVQNGLYRYMRHPSYTGLLVAFLGFGLSFANWLSLLALVLPVTLGVLNRVVREERALLDSLGAPYAAYCAHTKRFIPWLV